MTMLWACKNLSSFPDPTKSIEDQDVKLLEILMFVEDTLGKRMKEQEPE